MYEWLFFHLFSLFALHLGGDPGACVEPGEEVVLADWAITIFPLFVVVFIDCLVGNIHVCNDLKEDLALVVWDW